MAPTHSWHIARSWVSSECTHTRHVSVGETFIWAQFRNKHGAARRRPRRHCKRWTCVSQKSGYVYQEESDSAEQVSGCKKGRVGASWWRQEGRGGESRDHYLSAPGREAATFGRGGGAGGFKLNYGTKTKKDTNDTNIKTYNTISQGAENGCGNWLCSRDNATNKYIKKNLKINHS